MVNTIVMQTYELVGIFRPQLSDDDVKEEFHKIEGFIADFGGDLVKVDYWGKKPLAYPIENNDQGSYVVCVFEGPSSIVQSLERQLKLTDNLLRSLVVKKDKHAPDFTPKPDAAPGKFDKGSRSGGDDSRASS